MAAVHTNNSCSNSYDNCKGGTVKLDAELGEAKG